MTLNIDGILERVRHRCGMHGKELPADEAVALATEVVALRAKVARLTAAGQAMLAWPHSDDPQGDCERATLRLEAALDDVNGGGT